MTLEELTVIINAETSGLKKQLNNVQSQVNTMSKNVKKSTSSLSSSFKSLFKGLSVAAITAALVKVGKSAIDVASDLEEVQNVVDVSFGSAASEINEFAQTAITQFGLTELQAKQFSSTFMSMSNGMGIVADSGKTMAVELTKLSADMASFYNVDQESAFTALKSVYTGESETLKKFGVVMTETNLKAFAMSKGITKSYSSMTQAEKVALRYNYVLEATANAQGDFARTSDSWANQVKLLSNQWNQLLGVIGKGLETVLKPLLVMLNKIMASAIQVANSLAKAFGGTETTATSATTSMADGIESTATATDDATESAKEYEKQLAGFDELEILKDNSSSSTDTSGTSDLGIGTTTSYAVDEKEVDGEVSKLKTFVEECKDILTKWTDTIPKLHIEFDTEDALNDLQNIGKNIVNTVSGWGSLGITLAINVANDLDLGKIGEKALDLVSAISDLASTVTDILVPALSSFYDNYLKPIVQWVGTIVVDAIDFVKDKIKDLTKFISEHSEGIRNWITIIGEVVKAIWKVVEPLASSVWENFKTSLSAMWEIVKAILGLFLDLGTVIVDAFTQPEKVVEDLHNMFSNFFDGIGEGARLAVEAIKERFAIIPNWFKTTFSTAWENVKKVFSAGGKVFDGIKEGILSGLKSVINALIGGINKVIAVPFNGLNSALTAIKNVKIFSLQPFKNLIKTISVPSIPKLASGGVLDSPTLVMAGEYSGASRNKEIVSPTSLMKKTFDESNENVVSALAQATRQLMSAIEKIDMNVTIGDDVIARSCSRGNNAYQKITGRPLITV